MRASEIPSSPAAPAWRSDPSSSDSGPEPPESTLTEGGSRGGGLSWDHPEVSDTSESGGVFGGLDARLLDSWLGIPAPRGADRGAMRVRGPGHRAPRKFLRLA